ncbi:MAG: permease-like cell division protein FtsX [Elusimicrobiaceae bacterium]|nr:permease-like cell division protein FtsX [Elusimicrobiaceae bacterium]
MAEISGTGRKENSEAVYYQAAPPPPPVAGEGASCPGPRGRFFKGLTRVVLRGHRVMFLLSLCLFLLAQTVLFFRGQAKLITAMLKDDLKILLIVDDNVPDSRIKSLESKLFARDHVTYVKFVSRDESFALVQRQDPELAQTVLTFGQNPMPRYFSIKADDTALSNIGMWMQSAIMGRVEGISGVSYNPDAVYALLQAEFYSGLLSMVIAITAIAIILLAFFVELSAAKHLPLDYKFGQAVSWMLSGFLGAISAWAILWVMVYPMKHLSPMWWSAPVLWRQAGMLACGAVLGWTMFRWKETR